MCVVPFAIFTYPEMADLKEHPNMHQVAAIFVPRLLREQQKESHIDTFQDLHGRLKKTQNSFDVGLYVRPRNQATVISVEEPIISMPHKIKTSSFKHEECAHCFFSCVCV
jgi:hypothetical protein